LEIEKFLLSYDSLFLTKMPREIFWYKIKNKMYNQYKINNGTNKINISFRNNEYRTPYIAMGFVGNDKNFVDWKVIGVRKNIFESDRNMTHKTTIQLYG
jgi:hypothetical protein